MLAIRHPPDIRAVTTDSCSYSRSKQSKRNPPILCHTTNARADRSCHPLANPKSRGHTIRALDSFGSGLWHAISILTDRRALQVRRATHVGISKLLHLETEGKHTSYRENGNSTERLPPKLFLMLRQNPSRASAIRSTQERPYIMISHIDSKSRPRFSTCASFCKHLAYHNLRLFVVDSVPENVLETFGFVAGCFLPCKEHDVRVRFRGTIVLPLFFLM
jgi:hypothetical protein